MNKDGVSILAGADIEILRKERSLLIEPLLSPAQIDPMGVDLRLDNYFGEFVRTSEPFLSPAHQGQGLKFTEKEFFHESYFLQPGEFVLGQSFEYIVLPKNVIGFLNGKSSLGRRGLVVHATANVIDPGWKGHIVFELANLGTMPLELVPLMKIARLVFFKGNEVEGYEGTFTGQIRILPPKPDEELVQIKRWKKSQDEHNS